MYMYNLPFTICIAQKVKDFIRLVVIYFDFFDPDFFDEDLDAAFLGTLAPFSRASESPIAMACLGLVTFLPLFPLLNFSFFHFMHRVLNRFL